MTKTAGITMGGRQLAASIFNQNIEFCQQRNLASKNTNYDAAVTGMAKGGLVGCLLTNAKGQLTKVGVLLYYDLIRVLNY